MNFFGHAVVAQRIDDDPAFLLGAMAPDLLPLCGAVAVAETSLKVAAGQEHHRRVDSLFHGGAAFVALQAWAARALIERGVPRGGARGTAHVGIELFLDGVLAQQPQARDGYARSLAVADTTHVPFSWQDPTSRSRWQSLITRLRDGTIPDAYRDPGFVAARIVGALASRPRLALGEGEVAILRTFLPTLQVRVEQEVHALTAQLLQAA